jgi:hypothetical protein
MVRFAGETAETAFIDFKLGSDAFIEVGGAPVGCALGGKGRVRAAVAVVASGDAGDGEFRPTGRS